MAGVGAITSLGTAAVWVAMRYLDYFNNPQNTTYIADPMPVLFVTALVCGMVSYAFMMVYDVVADTILYCSIRFCTLGCGYV